MAKKSVKVDEDLIRGYMAGREPDNVSKNETSVQEILNEAITTDFKATTSTPTQSATPISTLPTGLNVADIAPPRTYTRDALAPTLHRYDTSP